MGTLSGVQDFFLQPIIKDRSKKEGRSLLENDLPVSTTVLTGNKKGGMVHRIEKNTTYYHGVKYASSQVTGKQQECNSVASSKK